MSSSREAGTAAPGNMIERRTAMEAVEERRGIGLGWRGEDWREPIGSTGPEGTGEVRSGLPWNRLAVVEWQGVVWKELPWSRLAAAEWQGAVRSGRPWKRLAVEVWIGVYWAGVGGGGSDWQQRKGSAWLGKERRRAPRIGSMEKEGLGKGGIAK